MKDRYMAVKDTGMTERGRGRGREYENIADEKAKGKVEKEVAKIELRVGKRGEEEMMLQSEKTDPV